MVGAKQPKATLRCWRTGRSASEPLTAPALLEAGSALQRRLGLCPEMPSATTCGPSTSRHYPKYSRRQGRQGAASSSCSASTRWDLEARSNAVVPGEKPLLIAAITASGLGEDERVSPPPHAPRATGPQPARAHRPPPQPIGGRQPPPPADRRQCAPALRPAQATIVEKLLRAGADLSGEYGGKDTTEWYGDSLSELAHDVRGYASDVSGNGGMFTDDWGGGGGSAPTTRRATASSTAAACAAPSATTRRHCSRRRAASRRGTARSASRRAWRSSRARRRAGARGAASRERSRR